MVKRLLFVLAILGGLLLSCAPAHAQFVYETVFSKPANSGGNITQPYKGPSFAAGQGAAACQAMVVARAAFFTHDAYGHTYYPDTNLCQGWTTWTGWGENHFQVAATSPCPTTEASQASVYRCHMLAGLDTTCGQPGTSGPDTPPPASACDGSCMVATTEVDGCYSIIDGEMYEAVYCRWNGMKTGQTCTPSDKADATKPAAPATCPAGYSQGEINGVTKCVKCSTPDCSGGGTGGGGTGGGGTGGGGTDGGGTDGGGTDGGGTDGGGGGGGGGGTDGGGTDGGGTDGGGTDGGGTDGGGDGDGEDPPDNPTPSGSLYTSKGKTLQSVMQAQQSAFANTGLGRIATTFFTVPNTGASCPTWSAEIPYLNTTLTFDFFCLELVAKILLVVKGVLLVIASYAAFRVAFG